MHEDDVGVVHTAVIHSRAMNEPFVTCSLTLTSANRTTEIDFCHRIVLKIEQSRPGSSHDSDTLPHFFSHVAGCKRVPSSCDPIDLVELNS